MSNTRNYPLLETVDELEQNEHHSMLLYDDEKYANMIKSRFVENGLKKGETVICSTANDVKIFENELASNGVDVDHYKRKNLLHFFHVDNTVKKPGGKMVDCNDVIRESTANLKPPFRFVGRAVSDISTKQGIEEELEVERIFHSEFEKNQYSVLCLYDMSGIERSFRPQWLRQLFSCHHNLIYASKPEKSVSFETDLLNTDEI